MSKDIHTTSPTTLTSIVKKVNRLKECKCYNRIQLNCIYLEYRHSINGYLGPTEAGVVKKT